MDRDKNDSSLDELLLLRRHLKQTCADKAVCELQIDSPTSPGCIGACKGLLWSLIDFGHILCSFFTQMFNYFFPFLTPVFPPSFLSSLSSPLIIFSSSPLHPSPPGSWFFVLFCFLKYELGSSGHFH